MLRVRYVVCWAPVAWLVLPLTTSAAAGDAVEDLFERRIRPILVGSCYECHGPDSGEGEGRLRLDSRAGVLRGGHSGPAVVPGHPERSLLIHAVNHDPTVEAMPPDTRLQRSQILALRRWIKLQAAWPDEERADAAPPSLEAGHGEVSDSDGPFWAFVPPSRPPLPEVRDSPWIRSPIDAFVLAKLAAAELRPAPPAARRTLIRRATYDLHGLPPTVAEVNAFLADRSAGAFGRLIDRLLASPRYGERWGRHWLDVARYSDSNGMDDNIAYADAWRYRDYVIAAFNHDKPYDRFLAEQLAGDLLTNWDDPHRAESVIATTFLMLGAKMPSADDPVKQQLDIVDEQLDTVSRAFLALTISCARCHDHKFDPFTMRDYYGLAGIFHSTRSMLGYRVDSKFNLTALAGEVANQRLSRLEVQMDRHDDALVNGNRVNMTAEERERHSTAMRGALEEMTAMPTAMAVEEGQIGDLPLLLRGNHLTPGGLVPRSVPRVLAHGTVGRIGNSESGRRELARWLTDPVHPLTARVMVNRVWYWHFGRGLVSSVDNFGRLGVRPENGQLLDWLALSFVESGWSIKQLHRLLMDSNSYRMAVLDANPGSRVDPENRLLWRMNRRRLEAEEIRDSILAVSQRLDFTMGGSLLPIRNHKIMSAAEIEQCNAAHERRRRTVYLPVIRSGLHDFLQTFDFPDPASPTGHRNTTTVAPQALYMLNSRLVAESSSLLAEMLLAGESQTGARLERLYEITLARPPTPAEIGEWQEFLDRCMRLASDTGTANRRSAWESICRVLLSSNEFMYVE